MAMIELDEDLDHSRLGKVDDRGVILVAGRITAPCRVECVHHDIEPGQAAGGCSVLLWVDGKGEAGAGDF